MDWKIQAGGFPLPVPTILGSDAAGKVAAVGSDVKNVKVGDRVFFQGKIGDVNKSTFQQYCIIPEKLVGKTPNSISDDEAGGLSLAAIASVTQLYYDGGLGFSPAPWEKGGDKTGEGKAVLILGGSSSVGQYSIQLARLSGFSTIITNSSAAHIDNLKKLGATHVLDRKTAKVDDYVKALGGKPLEGIADSISEKETQMLAVEIYKAANAAAPKQGSSRIALVLGTDDEAAKAGEALSPKVELPRIMGMGHSPDLRHLSEPYYAAVGGENGWNATGKYFPNKVEVTQGGLNGLQEALDKNRKGVSGVKVVIRPTETN